MKPSTLPDALAAFERIVRSHAPDAYPLTLPYIPPTTTPDLYTAVTDTARTIGIDVFVTPAPTAPVALNIFAPGVTIRNPINEQRAFNAVGLWQASERRIVIVAGFTRTEIAHTVIHELAHALLGHRDRMMPSHNALVVERAVREIQAETTHYLVGTLLPDGPTGEESYYVADFARSLHPDALTAIYTADADRFCRVAEMLAATIHEHLETAREVLPVAA